MNAFECVRMRSNVLQMKTTNPFKSVECVGEQGSMGFHHANGFDQIGQIRLNALSVWASV